MARSRKYTIVIWVAVLCTCLFQTVARAEEKPAEFIERLAQTAIGTLTESSLTLGERQERFRGMLRNGFDIDGVSAFLLGPFRRQATSNDLSSFREALEDNVVATYAWRFGSYNGQRFEVLGTRDGRRKRKVVSSVIEAADGSDSIAVDWVLSPVDESWRIFDIVIEGLSMLVTQRDEYASVIRRNGGKISALTEALREQSAKLNSRQRGAKSG